MGCFNEMSIERQQAEAEKQADFIIKPKPGKVYSEEEAMAVAENIMRLSIRFRKLAFRMSVITVIFTMAAYIIGYLIGKGGY